MKVIITIFCFLVSLTLSAQKTNRQAIEEALMQYQDLDADPQLLLLERSLQKAESAFFAQDTTTIKVYEALSSWYNENKNFDEALRFSKKALDALLALDQYPDRLAETYLTMGEQFLENYSFDRAGDYFEKSIAINNGQSKATDFRNYKGLATVLLSQGNFNIQIDHAKYAYDLASSPMDKCNALHAQFQGYARLGDIKSCQGSIKEQLELAKANNLPYERGRAYTSLGWVHNIEARKAQRSARRAADESTSQSYKTLSENKFREAITYYDKGVAYMKGSKHKDEVRTISYAYKNISNQYKSLGKLDLSIQYAKQAIQENKSHFGKDYYPELADLYHNLATKYSLGTKYGGPEDFEAALRQIQNAIKSLLQDESFSDARKIIPKEQLYKVSIKWQLLTELKEKALCYAHLYLKHKNIADLESAERHLSNAVELIDIMRAELSTEDTKIFWRKRTRFIYNTAIEVAEWMGDKEKVYKYMEKSRALLLLDELNNKDAKSLIPEALADRERALRYAFLDGQETDVLAFKKYSSFLDSLKLAYPNYYEYKFDVDVPSIAKVQNAILDDSTQVLSYHITPDSLYLLNITNEAAELITSPRPRALSQDVEELLTLVGNKDSLEYQHNYERFIDVSSGLYDLLFAKVSKDRPKVIVVGDGVINYVPFGVLVSKVEDGVPRYLIQDYTFSMAPSLSVLMKYNGTKKFDRLLMLSPGSFDNKEMTTLSQSSDEVERFRNFSRTDILDKDEATFGNFVAVCEDYDIIHFSTHSGVDGVTKKPWIAFKDSLVSLDEVYKFNLNAALVTLSSCKSSDGLNRVGEGVNSLARAFLFADAASVVGSMWNLNEVSGNQILLDFYKGLKKKKNKPAALRAAKLKFISENKYKSPYYWSSLVLVGDPTSLETEAITSGLNINFLLVFVIIFILLVLLYKALH